MPKRESHPDQTTEEQVHDVAPEGTPESPEPSNLVDSSAVEEALKEAREERDMLKDQLVRAMADLQNVRRRAQTERQQLQQFATEQLVRELLPVLDNFERTIDAVSQGADVKAVVDGVKMVDRQLRTVLESQRVNRIKAKDSVFDPELHEAIATEENHELPEGTITTEIEAGYKMGDKVIRPARVKVARKP